MRLTEKYNDNSGYGAKQNNPQEQHLYIDLDAYEKCVAKLGQLEDIEEELGVDLITYFKLKSNTNFWIINTYRFLLVILIFIFLIIMKKIEYYCFIKK